MLEVVDRRTNLEKFTVYGTRINKVTNNTEFYINDGCFWHWEDSKWYDPCEKENIILYLVTADTCMDDDYGSQIECFGVATTYDDLDKLNNDVIDKGFEPLVTIIQSDSSMQEVLGGYVE